MSLLSRIVDGIIDTVQKIGRKAKFTDIIKSIISWIPGVVFDLGALRDADAATRIDAAIAELKRLTGTELGAFDLIKDLPQDKEDQLFNAIGDMIGILAKHQARVPGYFVEGLTDESDPQLINSLAMAAVEKAFQGKIGGGDQVNKAAVIPLNLVLNGQAGQVSPVPGPGGVAAPELRITDAGEWWRACFTQLDADDKAPGAVLVADQVKHIRWALIALYRGLN